jgi:hypothetical protein
MSETTNLNAYLAYRSYENLRIGENVDYGTKSYVVIDSADNPLTGFSATTYKEYGGDHTVIAYRGTNDLADGLVDGFMVSSRVDLQAMESEIYTARTLRHAMSNGIDVNNPGEVTVTGHSLGGGLAQLNAEKFGLRGETFNAYGIVGLRGHLSHGDGQVINHVRATDVVSAASEHYGEVRVYATGPDISSLQAAGYGLPGQRGTSRSLGALDITAHYMDNFVDTPDSPTIVNDVTLKRYEDNKSMVDAFRHDVLTQRTSATIALDQPTLAGARVMQGATEAMATTVVGQAIFVAGQAARDAGAVRDGAKHAAGMFRSAMNHVAETLSEPHVATALGSATYGAPTVDRPRNDHDLRRADHAGHALYVQAYKGVEGIDHDLGRKPDANTEKLAGAIAVAGARDGLQRIDHVILNGDGSKAFGVQGELNSPFKQIVQVDTAQAIKTPLEQSSQQWHGAVAAHQQEVAQRAARNQEQAQTQVQTQAAIRPNGP